MPPDELAQIRSDTERPEKVAKLSFGKKRGNIAKLTTKHLKEKLKLVGIKITKMIKGKRKPLTRKELENKAMSFRKIQLKAKSLGIRLKYKSKNGYKYKTSKRLKKEIKKSKKSKDKKSKGKSSKPKCKPRKRTSFG